MSRKPALHLHLLALLLGSTGVCAEVACGALALPRSLDAGVGQNRHRRVYSTLPNQRAAFGYSALTARCKPLALCIITVFDDDNDENHYHYHTLLMNLLRPQFVT